MVDKCRISVARVAKIMDSQLKDTYIIRSHSRGHQKGVIRTLPPVPKSSFYAIVFCKNEDGINKLCLQVWNDVSCAADNNLNAIKFTKVSSQLLKILILFPKERRKFTPNQR